MLREIIKHFTTLGPIGNLPGGGTWASLVTIPVAYLLVAYKMPYVLCLGTITLISGILIQYILPDFGARDPRSIVLDEVIGALCVLYMPAWNWWQCIVYISLFRFFDITKIAGIRFFELLPGAFGIIMDDVIAAGYARVIVWLLFF